jgi:GNAT superfamily N-acetyltransferase
LILTNEQIESFYRFFFRGESEERISVLANALRARIKAGTDSLNTRYAYSVDDTPVAFGSVSKMQNQVYGLTVKTAENHCGDGLNHILQDTIHYLRSISAQKLHYRAIVSHDHAQTLEVLAHFGFKKLNERVEFRTPISKLPNEEGTPLVWHPMQDKSDASIQHHGQLLEACGQGDPDWSPDDNAFELLKEYLSDSALNGAASCVQVGFYQEKSAAMVVAQVNPTTGWSRITYMGIMPEFRGKGLGRWVHRHGFSMLREQGGEIYHGGTLVKNAPMRKLFEAHVCTEFQRLEEWVLELAK